MGLCTALFVPELLVHTQVVIVALAHAGGDSSSCTRVWPLLPPPHPRALCNWFKVTAAPMWGTKGHNWELPHL